MFEILERCIDLCIASHTVLNYVIGQGMGGKNVSTVWKVSIPNNRITRPAKIGIIWFSPECILRSNFQRANVCWKCPSLFSFWMTTSQEIFGGKLFRLIFTRGKLCVLTLRNFLSKGVMLCTLLTEAEFFDFSWNVIPCAVWILPFKFSFLQSQLSHQIYVRTYFPGWSGSKGRGFFSWLSSWDNSACAVSTFNTVS